MFLWEHCRSPACATNGTTPAGYATGLPWPTTDSDVANHYPESRHSGVFGVMFCDGHVQMMRVAELQSAMYFVQ
ncbi:MAG: H-X9-DG-CTERM domain-containing protein [Gemmataceae bacterium]